MLGWEFPPHISGGLGTACHGLAHALVRRGARITFVLPRVAGDEHSKGLRIVGAADAPPPSAGPASEDEAVPGLDVVPVRADLRPYDRPGARERTARPARRAVAAKPSAAAPESSAAAPSRAQGHYGPGLFREVERYRDAARRIARRGRHDVVHAHDWMTWPAGAAAARAAGVPFVAHVHSCEYDRTGARADPRIVDIERRGLAAADLVVCVSRYTADVVAARYGVDPSKLRVVHNAPADGPLLRRRGGRRRMREPVVLFLGRVTYQKGPELFLEAAARVVRTLPAVKFVVAGTGDLYHGTIERAAELGLDRHVHFTGFLRGGDVERAYREADLYVLPSVSEPFGITPLEAVRAGIPVLVSRRSGVAEVLPSVPLFDPWDVDELARRIVDVLERPSLRRRIVAGARRDLARLRWDEQARKLLDVYAELAP